MSEVLAIIDGGAKGRFGEAVAQAIAGAGASRHTKDRPLIDRINFEMIGGDLLVWGTDSYVAVRATIPASAFDGEVASFSVRREDFKVVQRLAKKAAIWHVGEEKVETDDGVVAIHRDPPGHKAPNLRPVVEAVRSDGGDHDLPPAMVFSSFVLEAMAKVAKPTESGFLKLEFPSTALKPVRGTVGDTEMAIMPVNPNRAS